MAQEKARPEKAKKYRLDQPFGYGTGKGALPTKMVGEVEEIYPAGTAGVGSDGTETVVLLVGDRRVAVPLAQFQEQYADSTAGGKA